MLALLLIAITLALLTLIVYCLHRYQTMKVEFSADRILPLPPLDKDLKRQGKPRSNRLDVKATKRRTPAPVAGQAASADAPDW